jgi:hypothetical protein
VDTYISKELQIVHEYALLSSNNEASDSGSRQRISYIHFSIGKLLGEGFDRDSNMVFVRVWEI